MRHPLLSLATPTVGYAFVLGLALCACAPRLTTRVEVRDPRAVVAATEGGGPLLAPGAAPAAAWLVGSCGALCSTQVAVQRDSVEAIWIRTSDGPPRSVVDATGLSLIDDPPDLLS